MKLLSLIGARPQIIKEAILSKEFKKHNIEEILVHSGQHYDFNMSDIFFQSLNVKAPDYNLGIGSGTHGEMTGRIMIEFEKIVVKEKPEIILVYGDTNTTLAGTLVGAKLKIPVAHVEAGIRQEPKDMPEEINRVVTDHVSTFLFCPSQLAVKNLENEGITKGVYFVGDVMYDLFKIMEPKFEDEAYKEFGLSENEYIVLTLHRDFNVDNKEKLEKILKALKEISKIIPIFFPIHPRTKKRINEFGFERYLKNFVLSEPLDYPKLMGIAKHSYKVITDSGGLQKEAYFAGKRCLVLMPDTGWRELVEAEWNMLADENNLVEKVLNESKVTYPYGMYGDGNAGEKIVYLIETFNNIRQNY
ncbi:UDP-N-acetylglucosamine 2-epimerase [Petrotoga sp. 8T1HF07.NaAc.6.1]|uniref:non-hydrolyzing UDP-N-acetylglucosamine 2-epimerase n=1 Tax=Petrotoga sp. 8T1HF07.NaAc.6.1 TaxID=1351838 RepID=UPI00192AC4DF|nr:UDP-N-acetylglucosamine 2-epimerase (non-hydrolyzing) [Petrotoga sp. 8T1HF07.NaAc.6.1]MBL5982260.1 UDP-N-acetylglucosamine 2-epimerase [Petrotoga sp. 8T1HF07.NaAc.6.1]